MWYIRRRRHAFIIITSSLTYIHSRSLWIIITHSLYCYTTSIILVTVMPSIASTEGCDRNPGLNISSAAPGMASTRSGSTAPHKAALTLTSLSAVCTARSSPPEPSLSHCHDHSSPLLPAPPQRKPVGLETGAGVGGDHQNTSARHVVFLHSELHPHPPPPLPPPHHAEKEVGEVGEEEKEDKVLLLSRRAPATVSMMPKRRERVTEALRIALDRRLREFYSARENHSVLLNQQKNITHNHCENDDWDKKNTSVMNARAEEEEAEAGQQRHNPSHHQRPQEEHYQQDHHNDTGENNKKTSAEVRGARHRTSKPQSLWHEDPHRRISHPVVAFSSFSPSFRTVTSREVSAALSSGGVHVHHQPVPPTSPPSPPWRFSAAVHHDHHHPLPVPNPSETEPHSSSPFPFWRERCTVRYRYSEPTKVSSGTKRRPAHACPCRPLPHGHALPPPASTHQAVSGSMRVPEPPRSAANRGYASRGLPFLFFPPFFFSSFTTNPWALSATQLHFRPAPPPPPQ